MSLVMVVSLLHLSTQLSVCSTNCCTVAADSSLLTSTPGIAHGPRISPLPLDSLYPMTGHRDIKI